MKSGDKFNELTVLYDDPDRPRHVVCKCSCGNIKSIHKYSLTSGKTKSCGHNTTGFKDLTGQTFGELKVEEYMGKSMWKCICSCGKEHIVHRQNLLRGEIKSCGHKKQDDFNNIRSEMIGKKFGHLTVLRYIGNKKYECQCDCDNRTIINVFKHNLDSRGTYSCGCIGNGRALDKDEMLNKIKDFTFRNNRKPNMVDLENIFNIKWSQIRLYVNRYNFNDYIDNKYSSKYEAEIASLLKGAIVHDRYALNGQELDFYIPDKKLAIEFNGNYFHSELYKDRKYHQNKTIECAKLGIRLIHIFEYEWDDASTHSKLEKLLLNETNKPVVIMGRKCKVELIDAYRAREFCNKYHLQGYVNSEINIGCISENELIGIMTFGKPRFNNNYQYELYGLCWKDNIRVIGGLEKLFKYFIDNFDVDSVVTYCDISKFNGNSYTKIGFKTCEDSITLPNYVWVNIYNNDIKTRYQTQKHKLIEQGLGTESETEAEIMHNLDYYRIYDSGNIKLYWVRN